jgi:hypothetical protein
MGEDQSHPVPFQDLEDRINQISFGTELDVAPGIPGNLVE